MESQYKNHAIRAVANGLPILRGGSGFYYANYLNNRSPEDRTWLMASSFAAMAYTDRIDGKLARLHPDGPTKFGGWLDQIADKVFVLPSMIILGSNPEDPINRLINIKNPAEISSIHWKIKASRDLGITALRKIASETDINVDARDLGKYKALAEFVGTGLALSPVSETNPELIENTFNIASGLNALSAADYTYSFSKAMRDSNAPEVIHDLLSSTVELITHDA